MEKLFVYGLLKPGYYEPKTAKSAVAAKIHADLFDLDGKDAGVKNVGKTSAIADGYVLTLPQSELDHLDKMEAPEFKRIRTKTLSGEDVWVYEYLKAIPKRDKEVEDWENLKKVIKK